ncbi:MAG: hypothetical protein JJ957_15165 [Pseudomonadales bacterium]|nr:hypothetical protein [Pseudomonadales bacterium]
MTHRLLPAAIQRSFAPMNEKLSVSHIIFAVILLTMGLGVFAIRLVHDGPYAMPHSGALYGAIAAIILGGLMLWPGKPSALFWVAILLSPIALFPALYSIMGESEEVISLYATDSDNNPADLRLWIVDREDGAWVGMPRGKAVDHSLNGANLTMLRNGELTCVAPVLYDEDRDTVGTIHAMKVDKYAVAQISGAIGLYPLEATETTVVLRLDPC